MHDDDVVLHASVGCRVGYARPRSSELKVHGQCSFVALLLTC